MSDSRKLTVDVDESPSRLIVVHVAGEMDVATAPILRETVTPLASTGRPVLLDLADLRFCDSTGLGALVSVYRAGLKAGGTVHLCGVGSQLAKTLSVTGLDRVFSIYPDVDAARPQLDGPKV
ncbi:MAG TPA: STAS domain-containing protein [Micromonosporaceae bacterium]